MSITVGVPHEHAACSNMSAILRRREVEAKTKLSTTAIYRLMKRGEFPKQLRLIGQPGQLGGVVGWLEDEIEGWLAEKAAARARAPVASPSLSASR